MKTNQELVAALIGLLSDSNTNSSAAPTLAGDAKPGDYVVVRCRDAGVHAGYFVSRSGRDVALRQSRRLWDWAVPKGKSDFLSGVATDGVDPAGCIFGCPITVTLTEACEVIQCTDAARESIEAVPTHTRKS